MVVKTNMGHAPFKGTHTAVQARPVFCTHTGRKNTDLMSALQIDTRPSDDATESRSYGLADLRAAVLADRATTVAVRAALGILVAVAVAIFVAGLATQSLVAIIGGAFGAGVLASALIALAPASAKPLDR